MAQEAVDVCLRVLKESNKTSFDSYSVSNSELIISHITFRDCRVHIFADNLSRNSCIRINVLSRVLSDGLRINELFRVSCCTEIKTRANKEEGGGGKEGDTLRP